MKVGRNESCPCGSGYKYKQCCESKIPRSQRSAIVGGIVLLVIIGSGIAIAMMSAADPNQSLLPPEKVWSEEHGHYHDVNPKGQPGSSAPESPPPPGKVWSTEHGHWHDAEPGDLNTPSSKPPGPAPPGKIWSEEHGHWHDAPLEP
jgi:hypothetical protein